MAVPNFASFYSLEDDSAEEHERDSGEDEPSEDMQLLLGAIHETGTFQPTERLRKIAAYTAPLQDEDEQPAKKKRKNRQKKTNAMNTGNWQGHLVELNKLIKEGLEVGPCDRTTEGGKELKTPPELARDPHTNKKLKLRNYQLHAIHRTLECIKGGDNGTLAAYGTGLGKTLIVIALFAILSRDYTEYGLDWSLHNERQSDTVQNTPQFDPVEHVQGGVLIVVPADLIPMWKKELRVRLKTPPKVLIYHGNKDHGISIEYTPKELAVADIVITSYETLRSDYDDAKVSTESFEDCMQTMIHGYYANLVIYWRVLVLDEAHKIANDETGVNKAINSVRALFRFLLTGTPFLNEYTDILSQLQLMRIPPFQNRDFSDEYFLLPPLPKETAHRALSGTLEGVLCLVMRACSVRLDRGDTFNGRVIGKSFRECGKVHWHDLLPDERAAQDEVKQLWDKEYKPEDENGAIDSDNSLKRMTFARLAAVHPECAKAGYGEKGAVQLDAEAIEGGAFERLPLPPVSNKTKRTIETKRADFRKKLVNGAWASSRLNLVIDIIKYHMSKKKRKGKIVVFSEFLCTLDALAVGLQESELQSILRFDGTVGTKERKRVVHEFENGAERHVLLITSRSGGLGRSFIAADCVIHIQPCYNPSLTYQTTNCVVRYPQDKMVYVHYLYATDSIELRVNELRNRKPGKAAGLFDPDDEVLQSIEEIRSWEEEDLENDLINSVAFAMRNEDYEGEERERGRKKSRPEVRGEKDKRQNRR